MSQWGSEGQFKSKNNSKTRLERVIQCKLLNNWKSYLNVGKCLTIQLKIQKNKEISIDTYYDIDL